MKPSYLCAAVIGLIVILSSVKVKAQDSLHLVCEGDKRLPGFVVTDIHLHKQAGAYLYHLDARQYDPSTESNGQTFISLNNGCDNFFELTFPTADLAATIAGEKATVTGSLHYGWSDEEAAQTSVTCSIASEMPL